nr:MAG TPA: hypothetical protein [Caudoviricetes sp.]
MFVNLYHRNVNSHSSLFTLYSIVQNTGDT